MLLSRGADVTLKTRSGQTARDLSSSFEVVALLQANESPSISPDYRSDRMHYDLSHSMLNKNEPILNNSHSMQGLVLFHNNHLHFIV